MLDHSSMMFPETAHFSGRVVHHNKYKTTIINPRNTSFETLVALLKAIKKLDKNDINITINDNQSVFVQNKSDDYPTQTTVENLQNVLTNIYETYIRKEN